MAIKDPYERVVDFGIRGTLGMAWEYGQRIYSQVHYGLEEEEWDKNEYGIPQYGHHIYGTDDKRWGVYQKRTRDGKIQFVRMTFSIPSNPQTEAQQTHRQLFADGMSAWAELTTEQKKVYNKRASKLNLHGVNLFLREYLNSH